MYNLSEKIKMPSTKRFQSYLTGTHNNNFQLKNINDEMTLSIVDKSSHRSSCGFDDISTKSIKTIKAALIKPITLIINQMLTTGIFADKLKMTKIIPLLKKGEETIFTNYRQISLLPAISKLFKKIIFKQLYNFKRNYFIMHNMF